MLGDNLSKNEKIFCMLMLLKDLQINFLKNPIKKNNGLEIIKFCPSAYDVKFQGKNDWFRNSKICQQFAHTTKNKTLYNHLACYEAMLSKELIEDGYVDIIFKDFFRDNPNYKKYIIKKPTFIE